MTEYFVNNNGKILSTSNPTIQNGSRGFLYGDGLFESIRIIDGKPINIEGHYKRLMAGAAAMRFRIPVYFTIDFITNKITELIQKNDIQGGGRCRLSIDRAGGGTFLPEVNEISFYIEVKDFSANYFTLNSKGHEIDIYRAIKKQKNFLSSFKTKNCLMYIMAALDAQEKKFDDYVIINELDEVVEATSSNIFIVSNGVLYTPEIKDGCVAGTMRQQLIEVAAKNRIHVYECSITPQNLLSADEVLLTNAIQGINWVSGYRTKTYTNMLAGKLVNMLNTHWKEKLENNL